MYIGDPVDNFLILLIILFLLLIIYLDIVDKFYIVLISLCITWFARMIVGVYCG